MTTREDFIERARGVHGEKYDYSKVVYKNAHAKVKIMCASHGVFSQKPTNHTDLGQGCPACSRGGTAKERFMSKIIRNEDGCWNWSGSYRGENGYGGFWLAGKTLFAHRYSYSVFNGEIPDGMSVLHKCDNPRCVNPDHLFIGTIADNVHDMHSKGRAPCQKGSNNPMSKLNEEIVLDIASALSSGIRQVDVSRKFGVTIQTVNDIKQGRRWAWLTGN